MVSYGSEVLITASETNIEICLNNTLGLICSAVKTTPLEIDTPNIMRGVLKK